MKNYLHYVYLTTNLINRKQYIGDHTINPKERKYYLGSGSEFKNIIKEYKEYNFFKEILEWFPTRREAFDAQKRYIEIYKTHVSQNGYNISWTGGTYNGGIQAEETKNKIRKTLTGRGLKELTKKRISDSLLEKKIKRSEEFKQNIRNKNSNLKRTNQAKKNMSLAHIGLNMPKKYEYTLISPNMIKLVFIGEKELKNFLNLNKMSIRLIFDNFNNGRIKVKRTTVLTKNTENWELITKTNIKNHD